MTPSAYEQIIAAPPRDRLDLFLASAYRLGTPVGNIEKDFWVCWTLDVLYHRRPVDAPRLLFKGGTSLSKAYRLIQRFSEDVDVTVFRDDLAEAASVDELQMLSGKQRRAKLDKIRDACRAYITGPLKETLAAELAQGGSSTVAHAETTSPPTRYRRRDLGRADTFSDDPTASPSGYPRYSATFGLPIVINTQHRERR